MSATTGITPRHSLSRSPPRDGGFISPGLLPEPQRSRSPSVNPGTSTERALASPEEVQDLARRRIVERNRQVIPPIGGPTVIFYPADDSLKSSEDTKRTLQSAIKPGSEGIRIQSVRMVGKSRVVVRTANLEAAQNLKAAAPSSLKAADPKTRLPRIVLRFLRSDISEEVFLDDLQKLNLSDDPEWSPEKVKESCKVALKKEVGTKFLYILDCTMPLRDQLIRLGKVYIGWDEAEVSDHVRATST
ncbi:unnamed protein product [Chilo suppressalis]|uniref:Uncharacterized protein n=1 Tax=Chilo suppressalis TaxID=168631 RepID=A0ABN8B7I9_CHISP|nr:unnamed protein product [Chilo suppressalis]